MKQPQSLCVSSLHVGGGRNTHRVVQSVGVEVAHSVHDGDLQRDAVLHVLSDRVHALGLVVVIDGLRNQLMAPICIYEGKWRSRIRLETLMERS